MGNICSICESVNLADATKCKMCGSVLQHEKSKNAFEIEKTKLFGSGEDFGYSTSQKDDNSPSYKRSVVDSPIDASSREKAEKNKDANVKIADSTQEKTMIFSPKAFDKSDKKTEKEADSLNKKEIDHSKTMSFSVNMLSQNSDHEKHQRLKDDLGKYEPKDKKTSVHLKSTMAWSEEVRRIDSENNLSKEDGKDNMLFSATDHVNTLSTDNTSNANIRHKLLSSSPGTEKISYKTSADQAVDSQSQTNFSAYTKTIVNMDTASRSPISKGAYLLGNVFKICAGFWNSIVAFFLQLLGTGSTLSFRVSIIANIIMVCLLIGIGISKMMNTNSKEDVGRVEDIKQQLKAETSRSRLVHALFHIKANCSSKSKNVVWSQYFLPEVASRFQKEICSMTENVIDVYSRSCSLSPKCSRISAINSTSEIELIRNLKLDPSTCFSFSSGASKILGCELNREFKIIHVENIHLLNNL